MPSEQKHRAELIELILGYVEIQENIPTVRVGLQNQTTDALEKQLVKCIQVAKSALAKPLQAKRDSQGPREGSFRLEQDGTLVCPRKSSKRQQNAD